MRLGPAAIVLATTSLALVGCGGSDDETSTSEDQSASCTDVEEAPAKKVNLQRPPLKAPPAGTKAVLETSCGTIEIELDGERAPRTAASFAYLVEEGAYDNTGIIRVASNPPIIQGGDPSGDQTGDAGYFVDEPPASDTTYDEGTVAMAKSPVEPPGRSSSQFFIVSGAGFPPTPDYALVGNVTGGLDVVKAIAELGLAEGDGPPTEPVVVLGASLEGD